MKKTNNGFTLLELMIVVVLIGIIMAIAAPAFRDLIGNERQSSVANEFVRTFHIARSEAAKRTATLRITATDATDGGTLNDANEWGKGWWLWEDRDNDNTYDTGEEILAFDALPGSVSLESNLDTVNLLFAPTGRVSLRKADGVTPVIVNNEFFRICDNRTGEAGKIITLNTMGRPTVASLPPSDANACP